MTSRLSQVLAAGRERERVAVATAGMWGEPHSLHRASSTRVVLKLAGLTNSIKPEKLQEGLEKVRELIYSKGVTTIVWDGDLLNYQKFNGSPAEVAFTSLFPVIQAEFSNLEWIYFKKEQSVGKLLASAELKEEHEFKNVLGPYKFLTSDNTKMLRPTDTIPLHSTPGQNYGIGFPNDTDWMELGLMGLRWLKTVAKVDSMHYFILGKGYIVGKELEAVVENPEPYPSGIAKRSGEFLGVEILYARNNPPKPQV
jgi:hypothetical protein